MGAGIARGVKAALKETEHSFRPSTIIFEAFTSKLKASLGKIDHCFTWICYDLLKKPRK